jgi:hypothetical protein
MGFALTPGEAPLHFSRSKNVMHVADTPGIVRFRYHGRAIIPWIIGSLSCFDYPSDPTYTQTAALTPTQTCRAIWKARLCHTRKPSNAKP